ncbi:MAG: HDIG domain-containing protein [Peptococcaceae bacterium]|nr:HDIG domain-containing protein [Peptococcaceae bacterium]
MRVFSRLKDKLTAVLSFLIKQRKVRRGSAAVLFLLLFTLIMAFDFVPERVDLVVGQVSPKTYKAQKDLVFEYEEKTTEMRRIAAEKAEKIYAKDPQVIVAVQTDISDLCSKVSEIQGDVGMDTEAKISELKSVLPFVMPDEDISELARRQPHDTEAVENSLNNLVGGVMLAGDGVTQDNLEEAKNALYNQISALSPAKPYDRFSNGAVGRFLRPNTFINYEMTKKKQEEAMAAVPPAMISVKEGEKLIGEAEIVTEEHLVKLQALGLIREKPQVTSILGIFLLVGMLMTSTLVFLYQQNRDIYKHAGHLYLLGMVILVVMGVGKAIIAINVTQWPEFSAQFGYMVPIAAAGMIIALLLDSRLAMLVVAILSLMLGVMTGNQLRFGVVGFIGGITGVYSISKLSQRSDLMRAGIVTSGANVVAIFIMGLVNGSPLALLISSSLALGLINGILSSILTNGLLPFLENTFRITSPVRLLEISNPNNILLKKLLTEAPGTYHHSIIVGNLAEAAADSLGDDSLLVRAGAYYHDIGKIKRPYFFIENQMGAENPHDKLTPSLSTLILTSHVKDGVEMAKEHKLPQGIIDIIEQHHGTSLVSYFYHKALESDRPGTVTEEEFRYEGPKPRSRAAAIVMLADAVEAAVRSLQSPTQGRVEGLVRTIIKDKLNDGQLEECDLTFKDLDVIANSFLRVLTGVFHSRIEYPEANKEIERRKVNGGSRKQLSGKNSC